LWRASQLARGRGKAVDTGYPTLSAELQDGGWPLGGLVELLVQQGGVGELRLLQPALKSVGARSIALLQPPHVPHGLGLAYIGVPLQTLMHLKAAKTADALWSAEQILRGRSCGALLYWAQHVQVSSLRRL
jgi:protein ImuA